MAAAVDKETIMANTATPEEKQASPTTETKGAQTSSAPRNGAPPTVNAQFPPPKTDKPRPHVCTTCGRSFARLEHLKRHERSHTKEKPFECPECTRCFARRDLLLRHQQKLHASTTPSSRPRNARRESTSSTTGAKVRKPSQSGPSSMRPRANTISHVDGGTLGMIAAANSTVQRRNPIVGHSRHPSLGQIEMKPMAGAAARRGLPNGMLKVNTNGLSVDLGGSLRTAPAFGHFPPDIGMGDFLFNGNTVNPAQLHFADSPQSLAFDSPGSPFRAGYAFGHMPIEEDPSLEWINGFDSQMTFGTSNEHAIAGSSPSAISTGSPGAHMEAIKENQMHLTQEQWQDSLLSESSTLPPYDYRWGLSQDFNDTLSPNAMDLSGQDLKLHANPFDLTSNLNHQQGLLHPFLNLPSQINSPNTAGSVSSGSNRHSSVTSVGTDMITDATRQSLLSVLSQFSGSTSRKFPQPAVSSPLSPGFVRPRSAVGISLPSTIDLQRFVGAYIQQFHPRLPFLHVPTLSFDGTGSGSHGRPASKSIPAFPGGAGDGGCLLLSMAAIGALFECEHAISKELFDLARKLIQMYLDERRRADMCAAIGVATNSMDAAAPGTPLWLIQSMLLNLIYGSSCGDRSPADFARTQCGALVSLVRAAGLSKADPSQADDKSMSNDSWMQSNTDDSAWYNWKLKEERKRTLYSIFVISSMLVSLYNFQPCLTNSEIGLELPCDESLWAAESASAWNTLGGTAVANQTVTFAKALSSLLTASQRQQFQPHQIQSYSRPTDARLSSPDLPPASFYSSSFGCLVLINALHNYIWETRQRHLGRTWTIQETEAMQAHIGPALLAYQAVWRESSHHSIQRPNPHLANDLAADCIPFLDLAFVRLFVSLGRSKECFWHRDWDGVSHEISCGCEILSHAEEPAAGTAEGAIASDVSDTTLGEATTENSTHSGEQELAGAFSSDQSTKRERHLRKAAAHAAHSLHMADIHGVSLADYASREVNIGSAICAIDCAEILAEWVAVVQDRVGRYIGVLGKDDADFETVPGMLLLEEEDISLLRQIKEVVHSSEGKLDALQMANFSDDGMIGLDKKQTGLSSRLLRVMARMCDCAATWSVMHTLARNLESQADHLHVRAERSLARAE